jgi:hypothetical protein
LGRVSKDEAIEANLIGKIRCPNKASTRHRVGRNPGRRRFDGVDSNHGITFMGASIAIATMMGMSPAGACRSQLTLLATGLAFSATAPEEIAGKQAESSIPD